MATVPLSGTNIRLLSGVPFSSDYKNSRWFTTSNNQLSYFTGKPIVHSMSEYNFQRIEGYHFIKVNKSVDELFGANYLMFQNADYNNKWFFAFITKIEYKQRNNTYVYFEIDVLQTWKFEMNFKPSFVIREHRPLWNADGTPVINTIDEGLNYGTDYQTVSIQNYIPYDPVYFLVIITKSAMHNGSVALENKINPNINGIPQPLSYYVQPFKMNGDSPKVTIGGNAVTLSPIIKTLKGAYVQDNAVNNVVSIYVTEYFGQNVGYDKATDTMTFNAEGYEIARIADDVGENVNTIYMKESISYNALIADLGNKYSDYTEVTESKLLMHPYTTLLLDDGRGNRTILKNEYIDGNNIELTTKGSLGTSNKVAYSVNKYLYDTVDFNHIQDLENALLSIDPNDIPVINDYLSAYLQGNRNSIATQKNAIDWNQITGTLSAGIGGISSAVTGNVAGVASSGLGMVTSAGDAALQKQAIESKIKDISNTPPQLAKLGGNTNFDFGNGIKGCYLIKKEIMPEYRRMLTDFFNMYGYKTNEVKIPNFNTRQNWNYIQTSSCIITGNFNGVDLQILKNIFDNGITLWHTEDVGNYSLENGVK